MDSMVAAQLKALGLATITEGLQKIASAWARLCVDHLPVAGTSLESLQVRYCDLLESLPPCDALEIERILHQYVRAVHLKGDQVTATQKQFLQAGLGLRQHGHLPALRFSVHSSDGTYEYLKPLFDQPESQVDGFSLGALFYVASHRSLGAHFPTFTDEFRDYLAEPPVHAAMINDRGWILLEPLIRAHAQWLARGAVPRDTEAFVLAPEDRADEAAAADEELRWSGLAGAGDLEPAEDDEDAWYETSTPRHRRRER